MRFPAGNNRETPGSDDLDVTLPPLAGFLVAVTADRRADDQIELLAARGAEVLHGPMLRTRHLDHAGLVAATRRLIDDPPHLTLLSTSLAVQRWFEVAETYELAEPLLDALGRSTVLARGKKTHGSAVMQGLDVHWQASSGTYEELVAELRHFDIGAARVAVVEDGAASSWVAERITAAGADVVTVPVYRWESTADDDTAHRLVQAIADARVDAVTFTCAEQVERLARLAADMGIADEVREALDAEVLPVCVGPVCAAAARRHGFGEPLVPPRARLGSLVRSLSDHLARSHRRITLGGVEVQVQGRAVSCDGREIRLTERESDTLQALSRSFGRVYSKRDLLHAVWGSAENDEHVVEVTVARLRKSLGSAGLGVETVHRRGYRLSS